MGARNWGPGILNGGPWEGWGATENRWVGDRNVPLLGMLPI